MRSDFGKQWKKKRVKVPLSRKGKAYEIFWTSFLFGYDNTMPWMFLIKLFKKYYCESRTKHFHVRMLKNQ